MSRKQKKNKKKKRPPPPPPPNPENYILINSKDGSYWRKKRGTDTPVTLNDTLTRYNQLTAITSPAAKYLKELLTPFLHKIDTGRFIARVSANLNKSHLSSGKFDLLSMFDYDFQDEEEMKTLMDESINVTLSGHEMKIRVAASHNAIHKKNSIVTQFFWDAIVVHGDPTIENNLRIESDTSPVFNVDTTSKEYHTLSLFLPTRETSWMLILKLSCFEGKEEAHHTRHYGMKVFAVGTASDTKVEMVRYTQIA